MQRAIGWLVMVVVGLVVAARPAEACGFWRMQDVERGTDVGWHINSATVTKEKRRLGAFYLDVESKPGQMRVVEKRAVVFDVVGNKLRKRGRAVATINTDGSIAFGDRVYAIALSNPHEGNGGATAWDLAVTRGDTPVIASTEATALCAFIDDPNPSAAKIAEEIRRRVYFYLAWRELGAS